MENIGGNGTGDTSSPATVILYKHTFNGSPYNHPYVVAPDVLDANLDNTGWTNSKGAWTNFSDCVGGQSLSFTDSRPDTTTLTLTISVDSGKAASIRSFSFENRSSGTGYHRWKMYINGIEVGQDTIRIQASNCPHGTTGTRTVSNPVENISGTVTVVLKLYDHIGGGSSQGTFRLNDFILNGFTRNITDTGIIGSQWVGKSGYRYGFNGQEKSNEIAGEGNSYTAEYWEYDPRLGRRWNVDPVPKEYESPYATFSNNPIWNIDPNGADTLKYLNNDQALDAMKIASKTLKTASDKKQKIVTQTTSKTASTLTTEIKSALFDAADAYSQKNKLGLGADVEFNNLVQEYAEALRQGYRNSGSVFLDQIAKYLDACGNSKTSSTVVLKRINAYINYEENDYIKKYNATREVGVKLVMLSMSYGTFKIGPGPKGIQTPPVVAKSADMGKIVGWGEGQSALSVQTTRNITQNLTRAQVEAFKNQGLTRKWVQDQLNSYNKAVLDPVKVSKNVNLIPRKELMEKIIYLWPK